MATASFPAHYNRSQVGPPQPQPNLSMVSYHWLSDGMWQLLSLSYFLECLHLIVTVTPHCCCTLSHFIGVREGLVYYFLGIANSCLPFLYFDALLTEMFLLDSYFLVVKLSASEGVSQSQICVSQVQQHWKEWFSSYCMQLDWCHDSYIKLSLSSIVHDAIYTLQFVVRIPVNAE